jgi:hypothetical protein
MSNNAGVILNSYECYAHHDLLETLKKSIFAISFSQFLSRITPSTRPFSGRSQQWAVYRFENAT